MFGKFKFCLIPFDLEVSFVVLSRDAALQEITKKVHLGGSWGSHFLLYRKSSPRNLGSTAIPPGLSIGSDRLRLPPVRLSPSVSLALHLYFCLSF